MKIKRLKFRNRLILSFVIIVIPLILISNGFLYFQAKKILETGIERELQQSSDSLADLIRTSADITIKNRLQAIAEKNFEIAEYYYSKHRSGLLTRQEAIDTIEEIFLNQSIGISGYIYCLNSRGDTIIHPNDKVKGTNVSGLNFVKKQLAVKDGYLEYDWKNPGETRERPKAVFMVYYKPLDWIISASSYRDEFGYLVDIKEFKLSVNSFKSGKSGYAFILDESGKALIHPSMEGQNLMPRIQEYPIIQTMLSQKNGKIRYQWQNPEETRPRKKLVIFKHLPEYKWIIGATSYVEEVFSPLTTFTTILVVNILILFPAFIGLTALVSKSMIRPLEEMSQTLGAGAQGDYSVRMSFGPDDELGALAGHFNAFMDRLETYHHQLNCEIKKTIDTQAALVENELKLRGLFNRSFQLTCILSPYGILEEVNKSMLKFSGCTEADILYQPYWEMPWLRHDTACQAQIRAAIQDAKQGNLVRLETTHTNDSGEIKIIDISLKPIINNSSQVEFIVTEGRDITTLKQGEEERRKLAVQLEKSQKMEAIGTLAGGIAHDFNNILSSIFGYAQLAEMTLDTPEKTKNHLAQIVKGAQRASGLVQQILTFSRQTEYKKHPLKFHLVVKEALKLLRSSIPTTIEIVTRINSRDMVNADPTQMHQVIMNLCTNAFHSMQKNGGIMTVSLDTTVNIEDGHCTIGPIGPGPFLKLTVKDTGHGMDNNILEKAFDPYFTTKEIGRGTGFGLALVHAIVDEHDGMIHVESKPGKGSSFYIYLPVVKDQKKQIMVPVNREAMPRGGDENIMVVDDEPDIRGLMTELLTKFGYTVHAFENGKKALEAFIRDQDNFDLVVTDMTMPLMTGTALAGEILKLKKEIPVILCSGYNETITPDNTREIGIRRFLQKPLQNKDFLWAVRDVLDS